MKRFFRGLKRRPIALISFTLLTVFYLSMFFSGFLSPYEANHRFVEYSNHPPSRLRLHSDELGFGLQVQKTVMIDSFSQEYGRVKGEYFPIKLFKKGSKYNLFGFIPASRHLFLVELGVESSEQPFFLMGTDSLGRDLYSRILSGSWISLTVGLIGISITFILAIVIGGLAGFYGGIIDWILMRISELFILIPGLYLILLIRGLFSTKIGPSSSYIMITLILSLVSWPALARVIRGMVHSIKRNDYVVNAKLEGIPSLIILIRYIIPQTSSLLIVMIALGIPGFILSETTLTYLGLGISSPAVSWGSLIKEVSIDSIQATPWILIPCFYLLLVTLSFNFLADLLRDVNDPFNRDKRLG